MQRCYPIQTNDTRTDFNISKAFMIEPRNGHLMLRIFEMCNMAQLDAWTLKFTYKYGRGEMTEDWTSSHCCHKDSYVRTERGFSFMVFLGWCCILGKNVPRKESQVPQTPLSSFPRPHRCLLLASVKQFRCQNRLADRDACSQLFGPLFLLKNNHHVIGTNRWEPMCYVTLGYVSNHFLFLNILCSCQVVAVFLQSSKQEWKHERLDNASAVSVCLSKSRLKNNEPRPLTIRSPSGDRISRLPGGGIQKQNQLYSVFYLQPIT